MFSTDFVLPSDPDVTITYTHDPIPWKNKEDILCYYESLRAEIVENCKESDWGWCNITVTVTWLGLSASKTVNHQTFPNEKSFVESSLFKDVQKDCLIQIEKLSIDISKRVAKHFTTQLIDVACDREIHYLLKSYFYFREYRE